MPGERLPGGNHRQADACLKLLDQAAHAQRRPADQDRLGFGPAEIEQARTKRAIVVSNYPTYRETGRQLRRAYLELKPLDAKIILALQKFDYTYDSGQLSTAIRTSYTLGGEVARNTQRLIAYRQLVEAGSPNVGSGEPLAPAASLLPLP